MRFGRTIERLRIERGWSRAELAEKLEMHPNHVGRWEKNQMKPRPKAVEKMAELFEVTVGELLAVDQVPGRLAQEDPELAELLAQVPVLDEEQRGALRLFLRSMITCRKLQDLASGRRPAALPA
jgi:transcriptional regulator with XRE-family HTH domain